MTKLTLKTREKIRQYVLNGINSEDKELKTDKEKLQYAYNRFISEYGHEIKRVGQFKAFSSWLSGLALDYDFYNCDILAKAKEWGQNPTTERQEDKIISQWFGFLTNQFFKLCKTHKVKTI